MSDTSVSSIINYVYNWLSGGISTQASTASAPTGSAPSSSSAPEYVPDEVIVKFEPSVAVRPSSLSTNIQNINALFQRIGVKFIERIFHGRPRQSSNNLPDLSNIYKIKITSGQNLLAIIGELRRSPNIEYAEPNYIRHTCVTPTDPLYSQQWALPMIQAQQGWDFEQGDTNVIIAVIDTGVDYNHPDIVTNIWINAGETPDNGIDDDANGFIDDVRGWDFVSVDPSLVASGEDPGPRDNDPMDGQGHGTHVAGIIAAVPNNGIGIAGVNWYSKIMVVRSGYKDISGRGSLADSDSADAIRYATDNDAHVINMSWGNYAISSLIRDAVDYAYASGVVLVAAAGNENTSRLSFPAAFKKVIAVAATDQSDQRSLWGSSGSNFGIWIDVSAPGTDILSLRASGTDIYGDGSHIVNGDYYLASGTSMAAAFVSGLASLILSGHTSYGEIVRESIRHGATDLGLAGFDSIFGFGRINLYNSISINYEPIALIFSPFYNDLFTSGLIQIRGTASSLWSLRNYSIEYGFGENPTTWYADGISLLSSGTLPVTNDILGSLDISHLPPDIYPYTMIRLRSFDTLGFQSEDRINIFIDRQILPGWPQNTFGSISSSPTIYDLDMDNQKEIIINSFTDTAIRTHIFRADGTPFIGWPIDMPNIGFSNWVAASPAISDINLDGQADIISTDSLYLYAWSRDGSIIPGWPQYKGVGVVSSPVLSDINQDGSLEIIIGSESNNLYVFSSDGSVMPGWPQTTIGPIFSTPTVSDLDLDGYSEIVVASTNNSDPFEGRIYAFRYDGSLLPGWPVITYGGDFFSSPVTGDIDGDGHTEIFIGEASKVSPDSRMYGLRSDGTSISNWPITNSGGDFYSSPALGDVDRDGLLEIAIGDVDTHHFLDGIGAHFHVWTRNAIPLSSWPIKTDNNDIFSSAAIGEINGDTIPDITFGSSGTFFSDIPHTFLLNRYSLNHTGWPRIMNENTSSSPAITDLNADGFTDFIISSQGGSIYVWSLNGAYDPNNIEWPMFQHDARSTGNYHADVTPPNILHTPVTSANIATNIPISAQITDNIAVRMARIWYKNTTSSTYNFVAMANTGGSTWQGEIPASVVTMDGVQYYLVAHDTSINPSINPLGAPDRTVYNIRVIDNIPPTINHFPPPFANACRDLTLSAQIRDNVDAAPSAELLYRWPSWPGFTPLPMSHAGDTYSATIPAGHVNTAGLQYYFRAVDGSSNAAALPAEAPTSTFMVSVIDHAPAIEHTPITTIGLGEDLNIFALITDDCGINSAQLFYRTTGESSWGSVAMTGSGDTYSAVISSSEITLAGLDYYIQAVDTYMGRVTSPNDAPTGFYHVEIIPPAADADADSDADAEDGSDADYEADIPEESDADVPDAYDGGIDADTPADTPSEEEEFHRPTGGCGCSVIR